jgi:hypothetical protein
MDAQTYEITTRVTIEGDGLVVFEKRRNMKAGAHEHGGGGTEVGPWSYNVDSVVTKKAEEGYRAERNDLMNWMQERAAPLLWTSTGQPWSAKHNLGEYLDRLERLANEVKEHFGPYCDSHLESQESCTTCSIIERLKDLS